MWEGPSGCAIRVARCSSLSHTWAVTLPEVAPSLLKKLKWPHHLSELWTTLSCAASRWYLPQVKRRLAAHPMRAEEIPLKRHSDTCPGISRSHSRHTDICCGIAMHYMHPFIVPTQEAYWYLPWYCYWFFLHAHLRGVLILAVGLLPISHAHSLHSRGILILVTGFLSISHANCMPHSSGTFVSCVEFLSNFRSCSHCHLFRPKAHSCHSRYSTVKLSWASYHYCLFWIYIINIYMFVISCNITPDHKYCLLIHHLVAMPPIHHKPTPHSILEISKI